MSVLVVGSIAYDTVDTPVGGVVDELGGSAIYGALACQFHLNNQQSRQTKIVGVVGEDFADKDLNMLRSKSVDTDGIEVADGQTFRWSGSYKGSMDVAETRATHLNVFETFEPKIPSAYIPSEIVFCANLHPSIQSSVLDQAIANRCTILDSMNLWIAIAKEQLGNVMSRADLIIINDAELKQYTNTSTIDEGIESLRDELGEKILVIKKGSQGSVGWCNGTFIHLPAHLQTQPIDPTGCGDSFAGTMAAYLSLQQGDITVDEVRQAMIHATVTASMNLTAFGTRALQQLTVDEYQQQLDTYVASINL